MKTYGLWTKMKAIYPFVGGTAASHKFNLKDPRDLDVAFRLIFNGGWTHTTTGAKPNGTTAWADTKLSPSTSLTTWNTHLAFYSRTSTRQSSSIDMGSADGLAVNIFSLTLPRTTGNGASTQYSQTNASEMANASGLTDASGFWLTSRTSNIGNTHKFSKNGIILATASTSAGNLVSNTVKIGSLEANYLSNKETCFNSIGDGLSDTEATNFYNSVQKFQTTLGRQIGSPIVSDTDAQAFINAAGLTDLGQANAVNTLVVDLKAAGVWTKMKALYPFVGGTATTHKWNLKDPRDLDAAFRLVFNGGWVHSATGALPNGTTGYGNTFLVPSNNFPISQYDAHISLYSRTNIEAPTTNWLSGSIGVDDDYNSAAYFILNVNSKTTRIVQGRTLGNQWTTYSGPLDDSRGFFIINKQNNTTLKLKKNDTLLSSNTTLSTAQYRPAQNFYIGAVNGSQSYSGLNYDNKEYGFISIGNGLTDTEATAFYTAVQKYQTTLGRQIGTPVLADGQTARLLDIYGDSIGAYSLRKLRTGYVGNAIRVRRSSDNVEQDIAFDTSGNLDTVSLLAFVGSGNGYVSIWYDQSGKYGPSINNYAFQNTPAYQPTIVLNGSLQMNGNKPAIYWDNSQYLLIDTPAAYSSTGVRGVTNIKSVFVNIKWLTGSGTSPILGNDGATAYYHEGITGEAGLILSSSYADYNVKNGSNYINGTLKTLSTFSKSTNSNILVSMVHLTNTISFSQLGNDRGFAGTYFKGYYSEIIAYSTDPTTNRTGIENNINSYYSIY